MKRNQRSRLSATLPHCSHRAKVMTHTRNFSFLGHHKPSTLQRPNLTSQSRSPNTSSFASKSRPSSPPLGLSPNISRVHKAPRNIFHQGHQSASDGQRGSLEDPKYNKIHRQRTTNTERYENIGLKKLS